MHLMSREQWQPGNHHGAMHLTGRDSGRKPDASPATAPGKKGKVSLEQLVIRQGQNLTSAESELESRGTFKHASFVERAATEGSEGSEALARLSALYGKFGARRLIAALKPQEE